MAKITGEVEKNGYGFFALVTETIPENYISTNATTFNYEVYIVNGNKRTSSSNWIFNAKVDGVNVYNETGQTLTTNDTDYNTAKKLFSGSKSITHNSNGAKTITFSASLTKTSSYSSYDPGACELSGSFKLTTIPRASSISCPSGNIGETVNIVVSKLVDTYTSTITWECGELSGIIAEETAEKTVPFLIPEVLYDLIPTAAYTTVTLKCVTFSGDTQIGDTQSTTMTARVAADTNKPDVSFSVKETNQKIIDILGSDTTNIGILNASVFEAIINASPKNGATISRYVVTNGSKTITSSTSNVLMDVLENSLITVTVYDSRGISNSKDLDLSDNLVRYSAPKVSSIKVVRQTQTSSNILLNLAGSVFVGDLASEIPNNFTISYKYKKVIDPETSWSDLIYIDNFDLLVDTGSNASFNISNMQIADDCNYTDAYVFEFYISDSLNTITKSNLVVTQGVLTLGIGKENIYLNGRMKVAKVDGTSRKDLFDWIYPVGSIVQLDTDTRPEDLWGVGEWERIQGVFLLAGNDSAEAYKPGATGGEVSHTLTVNEMPTHTHIQNAHGHRARYNSTGSVGGSRDIPISSGSSWKGTGTWLENTTATNQNAGGGAAHNNMPPFYAVYTWKRVA